MAEKTESSSVYMFSVFMLVSGFHDGGSELCLSLWFLFGTAADHVLGSTEKFFFALFT